MEKAIVFNALLFALIVYHSDNKPLLLPLSFGRLSTVSINEASSGFGSFSPRILSFEDL